VSWALATFDCASVATTAETANESIDFVFMGECSSFFFVVLEDSGSFFGCHDYAEQT
jgi:uncharacterized membrane protein YoaT (DUF817 family)